jgi:hypothetical protein
MARAIAVALLVSVLVAPAAMASTPDLGKQIQQRLARASVGLDPAPWALKPTDGEPAPVEAYDGTVVSAKQSFQMGFAVYASEADAKAAYEYDVQQAGGLSWEGPTKEFREGRVIYSAFINATGYGPGAGYGPQPTVPLKRFRALIALAQGNV